MVRKIVDVIPDEQLEKDLEKYRRRAIELGATDAKVIKSSSIILDERVRAKCRYPRCRHYGTNANCPPYVNEVDEVQQLVNKYKYAIFIAIKIPSKLKASVDKSIIMQEIVSKIEVEAFNDGYYFALGFACGSCQSLFCDDLACEALKPAYICRHPLKARPQMESVGMDVYAMATKVGWDIYPIGINTNPSSIPHAHRLGLVLIH
jgi:predicted metal-binding protein